MIEFICGIAITVMAYNLPLLFKVKKRKPMAEFKDDLIYADDVLPALLRKQAE